MPESLLAFLLARLDQLESPVFLHGELEQFPGRDLEAFIAGGLLRQTSRATEIPRPAHVPGGGFLLVRETAKGLFGVAGEDDYFDPVTLTEDDVRQYEVSLPRLVARIREENAISGTGFERRDGLIALGQRTIEGRGAVDVYLSFPNEDEEVLLSRCRRLNPRVSVRRAALLVPRRLSPSAEGRREIDAAGVIVLPIVASATSSTCAADWSDPDLLAALGARKPKPGVGRKGGRPPLSQDKAHAHLLRAMTLFYRTHDVTERVTNVALAEAAGVNPDTITDWLTCAGWTREDDLEREWSRRRRRKPE